MNIFLFLGRLRRRVVMTASKAALLRSVFLLTLGFIFHMICYRIFEQVDWLTSMWVTWATFSTVGYGDVSAGTLYGRLTTIVVGTAGIAVLASFFTAFVEHKISLRDQRRFGLMDNKFKQAYVIFNFPNVFQIQMLLQEIGYVESEAKFCIVDGRLNELPPELASQENICFVKGRILDQATYKRANLTASKAVIVFPVEPSVPDSDATTQTIVDLVERFAGKQTRIIHILVDPSNAFLFDKLRSVPIQESFELFAVVQECQDPFSSLVAERMLRNTEGANPQTVIPIKSVGLTWAQLQLQVIETGARLGINLNPLALIRGKEIRTCPDFSETIKTGDKLSILAHHGFDWEKFEVEMTSKT